MPRVSGVSGVWIDNVSVWRSSSSRRRGAGDAERQLDAVRQIGVVEHDAKIERLGAQRHRGADPAEPDDAEGLHAEPADQLAS